MVALLAIAERTRLVAEEPPDAVVALEENIGRPLAAAEAGLETERPEASPCPVDGLARGQRILELVLDDRGKKRRQLGGHGIEHNEPPRTQVAQHEAAEGLRVGAGALEGPDDFGHRPHFEGKAGRFEEGLDLGGVGREGNFPHRPRGGQRQVQRARFFVKANQCRRGHLFGVVILRRHPEDRHHRPLWAVVGLGQRDRGVGFVEGERRPSEESGLLSGDHGAALRVRQRPGRLEARFWGPEPVEEGGERRGHLTPGGGALAGQSLGKPSPAKGQRGGQSALGRGPLA